MIRAFLDVSSGHLSADTWAWLDAQLSDALLRDPKAEHAGQIAGGRTRFGWFVYAPEDMPEGLAQDLMTMLTAARAQGAEYVLFDADAAPTEGFPLLHPDFLD
jgi:hypothetical protein